MARWKGLGRKLCWAAVICLTLVPAYAGEIDFDDGFAPGEPIDKVFNGKGATGLPGGYVGVFGFLPSLGAGFNAAIIFDSECGGPPYSVHKCSGPDPAHGDDGDLGTPNEDFGGPGRGVGGSALGGYPNMNQLFNLAIVGESFVDGDGDGFVDDPSDADEKDLFLEFDFRTLNGKKRHTVNSIRYVDNDEGEFNARILFYGPGTLNPSDIGIVPVGDNGVNTLTPGITGVTHMQVLLDGSGAVDSIVLDEEIQRPCWVTTGGFNKGEVEREDSSGVKICTFGGNVGPPPSGAFEVNWHDGPLAGSRFHTNDIEAVRCEDESDTGPGQPGGKKGLVDDTLYFDCAGKFDNEPGFTCDGFLRDGGEPGGKKGNDPDEIQLVVYDSSQTEVARCEGILSGGNVQIHPAVGNN